MRMQPSAQRTSHNRPCARGREDSEGVTIENPDIRPVPPRAVHSGRKEEGETETAGQLIRIANPLT